MSNDAVEITELCPGIVQIRMQDRENKNTFSESLIRRLVEAYQKIN